MYCEDPARGRRCRPCARNASLTSSTLVSRSASNVRSTSEPVGTGARTAKPCSLPLSSGSTRPTAFAAPVEVGTRLIAAARARRRSRVRRVLQVLVGRVGVDRRHQAVLDADRLV